MLVLQSKNLKLFLINFNILNIEGFVIEGEKSGKRKDTLSYDERN